MSVSAMLTRTRQSACHVMVYCECCYAQCSEKASHVWQKVRGSHVDEDQEVADDDLEVGRPPSDQRCPQVLYLCWVLVPKLKHHMNIFA